MADGIFNQVMSFFKPDKSGDDYRKLVQGKMALLSGSAGELAKEFLYKNSGSEPLSKIIAGKKTMEQVLSGGLKVFFHSLTDKKMADDLCELVLRLPSYTYDPSGYRRSYRSTNLHDYTGRIRMLMSEVYFDWKKFDLPTYLKMSEAEIKEKSYKRPANFTISQLIALEIDRGNKEIIDAVTDIILSDNNVKIVGYELIHGVAMSKNKELHMLIKNLLLAAKLQEGLRQAILETADDGTVEYFTTILDAVLENNLIRFSSCLRTVGVWMGIGYDYSDKRAAEKLLNLAVNCLKDENARKTALDSGDVVEMYAAMWAESVFSIQNLLHYINRYMQGEKYQKMVALYFLYATNSPASCTDIAGRYLDETDMDVLTLVVVNYFIWNDYIPSKEVLSDRLKAFPHLKDKNMRNSHFERLSDILKLVPKNGYTVSKKPFDWCSFTMTRGMVFKRLMIIAAYDFDKSKIEKLRSLIEYADSEAKQKFLELFVSGAKTKDNKTYLISCLHDKSVTVRLKAVKQLKELKLGEDDMLEIEGLLSLKTGGLRQAAIDIIKGQGEAPLKQSLRRLISSTEENKRLGALDILTALKKEARISQNEIGEYVSSMPSVTERESILVRNLTGEDEINFSEENGFGLYDPDYYPELPTVERDKTYNAAAFKKIKADTMIKAMEPLIALIEKHKDCTFKAAGYGGEENDAILGNSRWLPVKPGTEIGGGKTDFGNYVLSDVWLEWEKDCGADLLVLVKVFYCIAVKGYRDSYVMGYEFPVSELLKKTFGYDDVNRFVQWLNKRQFAYLAGDIVSKLLHSKDSGELFGVCYGVLSDAFLSVPANMWTKKIYPKENRPGYYYGNREEAILADTNEMKFFINNMRASGNKSLIAKKLSLCYEIGRASGKRYKALDISDVVCGTGEGILPESELCRAMMHLNGPWNMRMYTGTLNVHQKKQAEQYPVVLDCVQKTVNRVIEIELKRGDSRTPVSELAAGIKKHKGAAVFAELLVAMGNETLVRGYMYGSNFSKKEVLSSLLKTSVPDEGDDAEKLKACLRDRVSEKRLLEAAMYAPSWISIVQDYLGWEGMKCGAWYFHAHTRSSYSAEFETEVARFSPIDKEDFQRGAFDINWFWEAYNALGEKRFDMLYGAAKYISESASHRRAQLFADAVLGKLSAEQQEKEILEKRNKDVLLSYSLIPFGKDKMKEALSRYEFIQAFLKKSKEFGAQRQASEKQAGETALENLARNMGYTDVLRFQWKMEMQKMEYIQDYFKPHKIGDAEICLQMEESGMAKLNILKNGKELKSAPAAIKNDPYIKELNAVKASLKAQHTRARTSLEKAMETQEIFTFGEITDLLGHPVISPLIKKLVFVSGENSGFIAESGLADAEGKETHLQESESLRIAHCYDLFRLGVWSSYQRYAFENQLTQPFKQIFRELYTLNEDEKSSVTVSRRYAGHQIQPKKTVALLKTRGWTVDYEEGLQKVYYRENVIAAMFAMADWFSPAEVEAPTLETVRFFERKSGKPVEMENLQPILFSEVMRDVDLVVSVAHVGGVDPMASHSTMEMRAVIVEEAMRLLKISNVSIDDRHARIKGVHGEYSVHLGSGIAHQMGRSALNIIPVHSQHRGRIFLPFMDEDPKTAEIVSKILLLAEDGKIKDPTVMMQINTDLN